MGIRTSRTEDADLAALEAALLAWQTDEVGMDALLARAQPIVRRLIKGAAWSQGYVDGADYDSLEQELMVLFWRRIAPEYDPSRPIYPLLQGYVWRLLASHQRSAQVAGVVRLDAHADADATDHWLSYLGATDHVVEEDIELETDAEQAGREFAAQLADYGSPSAAGLNARTASQNKRTLGEDHRELRAIRKALHLTRAEYARALAIPEPRLASYLSGYVREVPEKVMHRARVLRDEHGAAVKARSAALQRPMAVIVTEWLEHLGLALADEAEQAAAIGVNVSTLRRWLREDFRPPLPRLLAYDRRIRRSHQRRMA